MPYAIINAPSSPTSGMGATVMAAGTGVSFRVWAPNAGAVQLLLKPDSLSAYQSLALAQDANAEYWSADVSGAAAGHQYRFGITNDPTKGPFNPGGYVERVDPRARQVQSADGGSPSFIIDPTFKFSPYAPPPPQDFVIYQLQVGSFRGKNDTIITQNNAANFKDVIAKLPYIKAMNFNAIQFLPNGQFPSDTGEGYAPTNYFAPEASEGSPDDLRQLIDACHQAGFGVFFDVIYNHVPDDDDNLWDFDGNTANNGGGIYIADANRTPWGWQPSTDRPAVHDFFLDNVRMWLGDFDADGLRFDSLHNVYTEGGAWWLLTDIAGQYPGSLLGHGLCRQFPGQRPGGGIAGGAIDADLGHSIPRRSPRRESRAVSARVPRPDL